MRIDLPDDILQSLPAPDSQGLVRVTAGFKFSEDGEGVELVEVNDMPVPTGEEAESEEEPLMGKDDMPDLNKMEDDIYA